MGCARGILPQPGARRVALAGSDTRWHGDLAIRPAVLPHRRQKRGWCQLEHYAGVSFRVQTGRHVCCLQHLALRRRVSALMQQHVKHKQTGNAACVQVQLSSGPCLDSVEAIVVRPYSEQPLPGILCPHGGLLTVAVPSSFRVHSWVQANALCLHAGPHSAHAATFRHEVAFLAKQGYACILPNFRCAPKPSLLASSVAAVAHVF